MSSADARWSPATRVVADGRPPRSPGAPVGPAVTFTSTYVAGADPSYGRFGNPTWTAFEDAVGALEGGTGRSFASGMAAIAACLALVPRGDTVLAPVHAYNGTGALLEEMAAAGGLTFRRADITDTDAFIEAMHGAAMIWLESPTNPMLEVADLPTLIAAAHEQHAITVCDNTFATPLGQRPLEFGSDIVVHSATKYLSGHSDLILGLTVSTDPAITERLTKHRTLHGAIPGPMEAWLALRGLRTLHVRFERACANARYLSGRLREHPAVQRCHDPGTGAMLAVEVTGGAGAAQFVEQAVQLWLPSTSLGGVESMLERRRRHAAEPKTVPESLLRISVGIEDPADLWADLEAALSASQSAG